MVWKRTKVFVFDTTTSYRKFIGIFRLVLYILLVYIVVGLSFHMFCSWLGCVCVVRQRCRNSAAQPSHGLLRPADMEYKLVSASVDSRTSHD